jgi:regulatory protein
LRRVERALRVHGGDAAEGRRLVDELIERFRRSGLLDDAAYATGKVQSLRRRGTSRAVIGRMLRAKGLSAAEAEAALSDAVEDGDAGDAELTAAARLARRKRLGPFRPETARAELRMRDLAALARAGFGYDVARRVIDAASPEVLDELVRRTL